MKDFIQLKERDTFKLGIKDKNGNPKKDENGELLYLEWDFEDIELPVKYNKCISLSQKAQERLKFDYAVIDKKPDIKGKYLLTKNELAKIEANKRYYETMEKAIDLFAGSGATNKIFGTKRYYTMFDDFNKMIEPFLPKLKINLDSIVQKIENKYKDAEKEVLKDE